MIVGLVFLPQPPLLLKEYASAADPGAELRARCRAALAELAELGLDRVVILAGAPRRSPDHHGRRPLGVRVAEELLATVNGLPSPEVAQVPDDATDDEIRECAKGLTASASGSGVGVLVMGDGSACRSEKAPGSYHELSGPVDDQITQALAAGDPVRLRLEAGVATELMISGRVGWAVVADALTPSAGSETSRPVAAVSSWFADPFGVGYHVAMWRVG